MTNFYYFQVEGGEESWHPVPISQIQNIRAAKKPMFVTALAVDKLVDKDMEKADVAALKYTGDFYLDWDDASSPESTAPFAVDCIKKMEKMGVNPESLRLYATGGKGFHCLVPSEIFLEKIPKTGITGLPYIFRELALELAVDTLDLRVYTGRMGRMWREANVERPNGKYKVPITWTELQNFSEETYADVCSKPRVEPTREKAEYSLDFAVLFSKCQQKVADKLSARKRIKPATHLTTGALPSFEALCKGKGIKEGIGFHPLAMQISIVANARGMSEDDLVTLCEGLITSHVSDGNRYDTPSKRERELRRMWAYTQDNPMYDPSVGALKSLLNHAAPDLEGLPVARADIEENIEKADNGELDDEDIDEFSDVAGVHLTRFGVYVNTEFGQKRVCAISFDDVVTLKSLDTGTISCIQAQVLVNGKRHGPQALELETFHSLQMFNRFCSRLGHAFQGTDGHVRGTYMRVVEMAKKRGKDVYITSREGLDLVTIPNHEIERLRSPFMIWADGHGVSMEPDVASLGVDIQFHGYPDQRGQFRTDLGDAPSLIHWLKEGTNKEDLKVMLQNMFACQKPQAIGKILGWTTACFYRMLFHKAYSQFPILHINGSAGSGKCLGRDTLVLMADGSTKFVQDVRVGDYLLGPDGGKRTVLGTTAGQGELYRVTPVKGEPYVVNSAHILSLRKSEDKGAVLSDGSRVHADADIVNVNVEVYAKSNAAARKTLKGWRSDAIDFHYDQGELPLDPYWLGCWLGDGDATGPNLHKPECNMSRWWVAHAESKGHKVTKRGHVKCPMWAITSAPDGEARMPLTRRSKNGFKSALRLLGLFRNKHIPQVYLRGSQETRLKLLAGLLDSDGSLSGSGYDWISKDEQMAKDFAFLCRSLGLACYIKQCVKRIKSTGFSGTYWRCSVSGDTDKIPCLDKKAEPRQQIKRVTVTGISVEPIGVGDYFGFELDGDHLFLLGDFTVTHNSSMFKTFMNLFYWQQEPKILSPTSTAFAITYSAAGSTSIPLVVDEYKPHEMLQSMHDKLKLTFRDSYNGREVQRGGGTRDNDDYRALHSSALLAPVAFIAEAVEEESALLERVVLVTISKPPSFQATKSYVHFAAWEQKRHCLAVIGKYLAQQTLHRYSVEQLQEDFGAVYAAARRKYMLNEDDVRGNLEGVSLEEKQQAKERTVFNFSVAQFGLQRFRKIIEGVFEEEFEELFGNAFREAEAGVFERMTDLYQNTQPEWLKVFNSFSEMSFSDDNAPWKLREGTDYAFVQYQGRECVELYVRQSYSRYRMYCRSQSVKPLYQSEGPFLHGLRDCPAVAGQNIVLSLAVPGGSHIFSLAELNRLGFRGFKN